MPSTGQANGARPEPGTIPDPVTVVPLSTKQGLLLEMLNGRRSCFRYVELTDAPCRSPVIVVDAPNLDDDRIPSDRFAVVVVWDRTRQLGSERIADLLATRADAYVAGPDPDLLEAHLDAFCRRAKT